MDLGHANAIYAGTTPGADGNTYVLFTTTDPTSLTSSKADVMNANWPENGAALTGIKKVAVTVKCNNAGTINVYESRNRGTNWRQIDTTAVAAPGATASFLAEFLIEGLRDFMLTWVNGGSAQSPFDVMLSFSEQRPSPL